MSPSAIRTHQILVVDDELLLRHLAQVLLENSGYRVITACDGAQALAIYKERHAEIDAILLDLAMPGLPGEEVLREVLRIEPQARVLIFSAHVFANDLYWLQNGAKGVIPKPFKVDYLLRMVDQALTPAATEAKSIISPGPDCA